MEYALALGHLDRSRYERFRTAAYTVPVQELPSLVGELPGPRWETTPPEEPVSEPDRALAVALLTTAEGFGWVSGAGRAWRTQFATHARTAVDLLVLFLDVEPHLRGRDRSHPALAEPLARVAFVASVHRSRALGLITRGTFDSLLYVAAAGGAIEEHDAGLPRGPEQPRDVGDKFSRAVVKGLVKLVDTLEATVGKKAGDVAVDTVMKLLEKAAGPTEKVADPVPADVDRARIAKHLERALFDERLDPGDYATRMLAVLAARTTAELAALVVDLPVPDEEPLRDPKPDHRADDLIAPVDRQLVVTRLNRAMAEGTVSLWEYETFLDTVLDARTYAELEAATARLPPLPAPAED
ncbi:DUF1707 SHOCT-like domain-containing protein [Actinophytocola xanthii]|uniref:DUF1707 domain-containing protein n=1 Tax=Actinophytocola xanthii TaxID=1912961 RepID=A0A1Q8CAB0_9PSEU|nr:DUF1707 domain-containing protein [Actinophytocola xanthii]OLF11304.1 hypothetical protein BU204_30765 [Actinophytocola xanthii]